MMSMTATSRCQVLFFAHFMAALLISRVSYSQSSGNSHLPTVPDSISVPEQRANYIVEHYWDDMDDSLFDGNDPNTEEQVIADFLLFETLADKPTSRGSFLTLLNKISDSESKGCTLSEILFKYLYGTDSPFRNDNMCEEWLGIMHSTFQSPLLEAKLSFYLDFAGNCKPGTRAKDFSYVTTDGQTRSLYDNSGSPLLLVFYSPGCRDCRDYENRLIRSLNVRRAVKDGLRILFVCPEVYVERRNDDSNSSPDIRKAFACDDSITSEGMYRYRSIPSAYLLDRNMNILLKEPSFADLETCLAVLFRNDMNIQYVDTAGPAMRMCASPIR